MPNIFLILVLVFLVVALLILVSIVLMVSVDEKRQKKSPRQMNK